MEVYLFSKLGAMRRFQNVEAAQAASNIPAGDWFVAAQNEDEAAEAFVISASLEKLAAIEAAIIAGDPRPATAVRRAFA